MHFAAALVAAAEAEHHGNPMMTTLPFFIIAAVVFTALALVTASYRNVANRHADPAEVHAPHETGHDH
jgi:heme/copper-type cytochrome/quinol oxidase subunit 2